MTVLVHVQLYKEVWFVILSNLLDILSLFWWNKQHICWCGVIVICFLNVDPFVLLFSFMGLLRMF